MIALQICALLAVAVPPCSGQKPDSKGSGFDGKRGEYPVAGVTFVMPASWQPENGHRIVDFARWLKLDPKTGSPLQSAVMQMDPHPIDSLDTYGATLAKQMNGEVAPESLRLGDQPALRLTFRNSQASYPQHQAVICLMYGSAYIIDITGKTGEDIAGTIEAIRASWRWQPPAPPTEHLALNPTPMELFDHRLSVRLPDTMGLFPQEQPDAVKLAIYDCRTHILAFVMDVGLFPCKKSASLVQIRDTFASLLSSRLDLKEPIQWQWGAGRVPIYWATPFKVKLPGINDDHETYTSYSLVRMQPEKLALFTFTMTGQSADDRKRYGEAMAKILGTVALPSR
jgi:hypothetical protein